VCVVIVAAGSQEYVGPPKGREDSARRGLAELEWKYRFTRLKLLRGYHGFPCDVLSLNSKCTTVPKVPDPARELDEISMAKSGRDRRPSTGAYCKASLTS
jgi:hypothetical protein